MLIHMPVVCGIQSHANLMKKVAAAIADRSFPVDLDCTGTVFSTSGFLRFVLAVNKKVSKAGGKVRLLNVDDIMYEGLEKTDVAAIIEISRKAKKGKQHG